MSDDGEDVLRRHNARGGGDYVSQQRFAGNLVQHLGMTRLQPRSFTGGEDGDSEGRRVWHWCGTTKYAKRTHTHALRPSRVKLRLFERGHGRVALFHHKLQQVVGDAMSVVARNQA